VPNARQCLWAPHTRRWAWGAAYQAVGLGAAYQAVGAVAAYQAVGAVAAYQAVPVGSRTRRSRRADGVQGSRIPAGAVGAAAQTAPFETEPEAAAEWWPVMLGVALLGALPAVSLRCRCRARTRDPPC